MKSDALQDYLLKNEHNLSLAVAVADAWLETRLIIVSGFLARLDERLKKKLRGWKSERYDTFFVDPYPSFFVSKPEWVHYSIGIQAANYGEDITLGIARDTNDKRKVPLEPSLLRAVQQIHPSANSHGWWEARVRLRSPATDWRKPEVLWRMHTKTEFLSDVANQILEIAKVSEPLIDRVVRKKNRNL
jgi:hypothetical protein